MIEFLRRLWARFWFAPAPIVVPETAPAPKARRAQRKSDGKNYGAFVYFDDVLDRLDSYFKYLRYLKKDDPDAFNLYSQMGGQIMGKQSLFSPWETDPGWLAQRPTFGMVHFADDDGDDKITPKLAYFSKHRGHANLQPIHGDIYEVVFYYVEKKNPKIRVPMRYHVHVSCDGDITLLKERVAERITIHHRHKSRGGFSTISRQTWRVPELLCDLFEEKNIESDKMYTDVSINEAAARLFRMIAGACYSASDGVRVNVYKGSLCCAFNVAMDRTAYFFKDREKTVSMSGATKRIFHAARAHMRVMPDGKQVPVRMHFRGERAFTWKGYHILITVNGKHHADLNGLSEPAVIDEINDYENFIDMKATGAMIKQAVARQ
jgi:hypothetical protein